MTEMTPDRHNHEWLMDRRYFEFGLLIWQISEEKLDRRYERRPGPAKRQVVERDGDCSGEVSALAS